MLNNPLKYVDPTGRHHRPEDEQRAVDLISQDPGSEEATKLIGEMQFEHDAENEAQGTLVRVDARTTTVMSLSPGTVIVVSDQKTTISIGTPVQKGNGQTESISFIADFPDAGKDHVGAVRQGPTPPGSDAYTPSTTRIVARSVDSMHLQLFVHEVEHIEHRLEQGWAGGTVYTIAYVLGLPVWRRGFDDQAERRAYAVARPGVYPTHYWIVRR